MASIPVKVYLINDSKEPEVRRFAVHEFDAFRFSYITEKIVDIFPKLVQVKYAIYWKDEDNDDVLISCDEELAIALTEMKPNLKKFYIKFKEPEHSGCNEFDTLHPMVFCDKCNCEIAGFRYKCIFCQNYDLCSNCEQTAAHAEHPMLRIPNPSMFNHVEFHKILKVLSSIFMKSYAGKHCYRKESSHDNNAPHGKKKRKSDKHESGPETDESEEGCHKKHSHKKRKEIKKCPYGSLVNEFFKYMDPAHFLTETLNKPESHKFKEQTFEKSTHIRCLKPFEKTLTVILDQLGIDCNFEHKQNEEQKVEEKKEKKQETKDNSKTAPQTEVKNITPENCKESVNQKIDEITEGLAKQKVNESPEKDDWVSFEELKLGANEKGAVSKVVESSSQDSTSSDLKEAQNLYPNISSQQLPSDLSIRESLEKMLSMGFTNDGNWLTNLLEAKNGDINEALNVLMPHKK